MSEFKIEKNKLNIKNESKLSTFSWNKLEKKATQNFSVTKSSKSDENQYTCQMNAESYILIECAVS